MSPESNPFDGLMERAIRCISETRLSEAETLLRDALRIRPDALEARINLGGVYLRRGRIEEAEEWYRKALKLSPNDIQTHYNLAICLRTQERTPEAIEHLEHIGLIAPGHRGTQFELAILRLSTCDWSRRRRDVQAIRDFFEEGMEGDTLHYDRTWTLNQIDPDPEFQARVARKVSEVVVSRMAPVKESCAFTHALQDQDRMKIGYVSPDFRRHAVGSIIHEMFTHHDRERFEIHAYSLRRVDDPFQHTIRHSCEYFHDVENEAPEDLARRIHADGIQILVDLAGYTAFCRPEVFALRPAPVQVQYLGFLNTMGAPFYDYTIADPIVMTDELAEHYTENIVYMPDTFMVTSDFRIDETPITRADVGLPEDATVFACFNTPYKIEPEVFDSWMRILKGVENSVIWLYANENPAIEENLRIEARQRGVPEDLIIFATRMEPAQHLARVRLADLVLDTYLYNAGATGAGILFAGVPILTRYGTTVLSRMGTSMLSSVGLDELVTDSSDEYESLAIRLGCEAEKLSAFREELTASRSTAPLFDTSGFVRALESAYGKMWSNVGEHASIQLG